MRGRGFIAFVLASTLGGLIMVAGYAIFEILFFNINMAIADLGGNSIQWAAGVIIAIALYPAVKKLGTTLRIQESPPPQDIRNKPDK